MGNTIKSPKGGKPTGQQWCITIRYSSGSSHTSRRKSWHLSSTTSLSAQSDDPLASNTYIRLGPSRPSLLIFFLPSQISILPQPA